MAKPKGGTIVLDPTDMGADPPEDIQPDGADPIEPAEDGAQPVAPTPVDSTPNWGAMTPEQVQAFAIQHGLVHVSQIQQMTQPTAPATPSKTPLEMVLEEKQADIAAGFEYDDLYYQDKLYELKNAAINERMERQERLQERTDLIEPLKAKGITVDPNVVEIAQAIAAKTPGLSNAQRKEMTQMLLAGHAAIAGNVAPPSAAAARPGIRQPAGAEGVSPPGAGLSGFTPREIAIAENLAATEGKSLTPALMAEFKKQDLFS